MSRVFANGPRVLGSILGRVITKIQKWCLLPLSLTFCIKERDGSRVSGSISERVEPSPTP